MAGVFSIAMSQLHVTAYASTPVKNPVLMVTPRCADVTSLDGDQFYPQGDKVYWQMLILCAIMREKLSPRGKVPYANLSVAVNTSLLIVYM